MLQIHDAAQNGQTDCLSMLASSYTREQFDWPDVSLMTPLILAACGGYSQTVEWLLLRGCNANAADADGTFIC